TNHADGTLYANTSNGITNLSNTASGVGTPIRTIGAPGNALGITMDPVCAVTVFPCPPSSHRVVYVAANCRFTSLCDIRTVDPQTGADAVFASLTPAQATFVDGIAFNLDGSILYLAVRSPQYGVGIIGRTGLTSGSWDHLIRLTSEPDGISFIPPAINGTDQVITSNTDGSLS